MTDMLVRLYDLPDSSEVYRSVEARGVILRRPMAYERHVLADWVGTHFSPKWVSEVKVALGRQPVSSYVATLDSEILGFSCYETTCKGYFGPTGVKESERGSGLGTALLFKALEAMRSEGYAYAVIGGVGPKEFYERACGAFEIPGSNPGVYGDLLPDP
ncbi:MAG: GNAT family N-acetyltransferase [Verrucomicrobiaceae bacterium]|nr:GNAT family N-acetyltransferase [Roseibacillus sp.]MBJ06713.1 GNAT family N-acetyltransferase [Verrucomicrobiaceae bacterium]|tara:strand:- start:1569 stop:2045 length:477 start_codon:yes stop_codon:yes gene_type:complete